MNVRQRLDDASVATTPPNTAAPTPSAPMPITPRCGRMIFARTSANWRKPPGC